MQMARELEFEVEDVASVVAAIEAAMGTSGAPIWVTDARGHRHAIAGDKVAFIEVESAETKGGVGFGAS